MFMNFYTKTAVMYQGCKIVTLEDVYLKFTIIYTKISECETHNKLVEDKKCPGYTNVLCLTDANVYK